MNQDDIQIELEVQVEKESQKQTEEYQDHQLPKDEQSQTPEKKIIHGVDPNNIIDGKRNKNKPRQIYYEDFCPEVKKKIKTAPNKTKKNNEENHTKDVKDKKEKEVTFIVDEEIQPWKTKLIDYQTEIQTILNLGIPMLNSTNDNTDLTNLKINLKNSTQLEQDIVHIVSYHIEGQKGHITMTDLTNQTQKWLKEITEFPLPETINLMDIITKILTKKNYLPNGLDKPIVQENFDLKQLFEFKKQSLPEEFQTTQIKTLDHCIYEIKENESLKYYCDQNEFKNNRKVRRYLEKILKSLNTLIQMIKKHNSKEYLPKIEDAYQKYIQSKNEEIKLIVSKKPKVKQQEEEVKEKKQKKQKPEKKKEEKTPKQEPKAQPQDTTPVKKDLGKQMKLTDMKKVNFNTNCFFKANDEINKKEDQNKKDEQNQKDQPINQEAVVSISQNKMDEEIQQQPTQVDKNQPAQTQQTPQDLQKKGGQQSLIKFFNKSNVKSSQSGQKPLLKQLDQKPSKLIANWTEDRESNFERFLNDLQSNQIPSECSQITISIHQKKLPKVDEMECEEEEIKPTKQKRKVYLSIFDSQKEIKGMKFNLQSSKIKGKTPIVKDDEMINYDLDSEDEIQEMDAESLSNFQNENESKDESDASDIQFIVPDGYLSEEEVSDKEEIGKEMKRPQEIVQQTDLKPFQYQMRDGQSQEVKELFQKYEAKLIMEDKSFPLKCKKDEKKQEEFWNDNGNMEKFIQIVHGNYSSIKRIVQEVKMISDERCSKNLIEKKLKELGEKKKSEGQGRERWLIKEEILQKMNVSQEKIKEMFKKRDEEREQKQKAKKEKENLKPQQENKQIAEYLKNEKKDEVIQIDD